LNTLADIITYIRRIIKSPSNAVVTDSLLIDYINRFWINDVDARLQLFDLKTTYQFQTSPGVDQYNMPLYSVQTEPGPTSIAMYPVYQGFLGPCYVDGVQVFLETQKNSFFNVWPNVSQNYRVVAIGNGTAGPYTLNIPILPNFPFPPNPPLQGLLRGHIDIAGIISTGNNVDPPLISDTDIFNPPSPPFPFIQNMPVTSVLSNVYFTSIGADGSNVVICDSGQFLQDNVNYGILMQPGPAPFGNMPLGGPDPTYSETQNTINYFTGIAENVYFPQDIPAGAHIGAQCFYFETGLPRAALFYNNTLTLRSPPDRQYLVQLEAYLTPAAFFNTAAAIPFAYMAEYIARGAARKILSDTGDVEQFMFYEPLFKEQELLVWKRSQRQWTNNRTQTIYSQGLAISNSGNGTGNGGGSAI
jgi:hypothetical protein